MLRSLSGDRSTAQSLQIEAAVKEELAGPWFHNSKNNVTELSDEINTDEFDDEYTWFSRSPSGGGHSGGCILFIYIIATPADRSLHTAGHGDVLGKEAGLPLKNWWLRVHKTEVDKLMVVSRISQDRVAEHIAFFQQDLEYVAIRTRSASL
jgi:hypothetical protein